MITNTTGGIMGVPFAAFTAAGIWVALLAFLGLAVRQVVPWKKQAQTAEESFRDALLARVSALEVRLQRQEAIHTAEKALANHKLRNITAVFDAMLMMLEMNPDRGPEIVVKIKEMRAAQIKAEAAEAAIIRAAAMDAIGDPSKTDAWNKADHAEQDAKQTARSTKAARQEVERSEGDGK